MGTVLKSDSPLKPQRAEACVAELVAAQPFHGALPLL